MRPVRLIVLGIALMVSAGCAFEDEDAVRLDEAENKKVIAGITPEMRENAAREIAIQAKNGTSPLLPLLYWSKFTYTPIMDGSCIITVTEKDLTRETTKTFRFDDCE